MTTMRGHWYIVCRSGQLQQRPLARIVLGEPLVLFRMQDGRVGALAVLQTQLDCATERNHNETADLLRKHGGKTGEELKAEGK